jgi:hypothetical protein
VHACIIRFLLKEFLKGSGESYDLGRKLIYDICGGYEGLIPILERHVRMGKEWQSHHDYMAMLSLSRAILLMGIWTRNRVRDPNLLEEGIEFLILTTPIRLYNKNFLVKETFNESLKFTELLKNLRFLFKQIYPNKLAEIINKTDIVFVTSNRFTRRIPHITKDKF